MRRITILALLVSILALFLWGSTFLYERTGGVGMIGFFSSITGLPPQTVTHIAYVMYWILTVSAVIVAVAIVVLLSKWAGEWIKKKCKTVKAKRQAKKREE